VVVKRADHSKTGSAKNNKTDDAYNSNTGMSLQEVPFSFDCNNFFNVKVFTKLLAGESFFFAFFVIFPYVSPLGQAVSIGRKRSGEAIIS
jgi:hypothetical protein